MSSSRQILSAVLLPFILLSGCERDPSQGTLYENVGASFESCRPSEMKWMAGKYNLMPAFEYCGSNNFGHFSWNRAGTHLYFDLTLTANLLNAENKPHQMNTLPIPQPTGQPNWLNNQRLAVPIVPDPEVSNGPERIALFDIFLHTLELKRIADLTAINNLQPGKTPSELLFTADDGSGSRRVHQLNTDDGTVSRAFPWLEHHVDTFTWSPKSNVVVLGVGNTVTLHNAADGAVLHAFTPATRGTLHPDGRWLALEHAGREVSLFYQHTEGEISERRKRQLEDRSQKLEESLPEWYPKRVKLPTLSFVDLNTSKRWEVTGFQGTQFQWYDGHPTYGSFILWGFEGKQYNRNVMLGDFGSRLRAIESDRDRIDMKPFVADSDADPAIDGGEGQPPSGEIKPDAPAEDATPAQAGDPPAAR